MFDTKPDQAAENRMRQRGSSPDRPERAALGGLPDAKAALKEIVAALEPEVLDAAYARELVEEFAEIERLGAAGKALAARRVVQSGAWKKDGDRSPAHWVARTTGTSVGHAVGVLQTAELVAELPATDDALRSGKLSELQAREVAAAAATNPQSEKELLKSAATDGLAGLKERCAKVKAAAVPDDIARYDAIRRNRRLRTWTDSSGAFRLDASLTPDAGALVLAVLEPHRAKIFKEARKQGQRDSYEAYLADALVSVAEHVRDCDQEPVCTGPKAMIHITIPHTTFVGSAGAEAPGERAEAGRDEPSKNGKRPAHVGATSGPGEPEAGSTTSAGARIKVGPDEPKRRGAAAVAGTESGRRQLDGEADHETRSPFVSSGAGGGDGCAFIPGIGAIPAATARALSADAILSAVVTKGVDVVAVAHLGRSIPAHVRTALIARDQVCAVPGCNVRYPLEIDHRVPVNQRGPTKLSNLDRFCKWDHYLKTHHGYVLEGEPGQERTWRPPKSGEPDDP